jgi:hypothetical protein
MPKQLYKIVQFHGGLNSNSDARDIADNELSEATDVMVDELGKIRMMGGTSTSSMPAANAAAIIAGHGLFQFSHDRLGGQFAAADLAGTHTGADSDTVLIDNAAAFTSVLVGATVFNVTDGSYGTVVSVDSPTQLTLDDLIEGSGDRSWDASDVYTIGGFPETGDDYLVMADADGVAQIDIYSRVAGVWAYPGIDLGGGDDMEASFYFADGGLRIADGNFDATNQPRWYGYVDRWFFGNGTQGYQIGSNFDGGLHVDKWVSDGAAPIALKGYAAGHQTDGSGTYVHGVSSPTASYPFAVALQIISNDNNYIDAYNTASNAISTTVKVRHKGTFTEAGDTWTTVTQNTDWDVDNFCSVGDRLLFQEAEEAGNNETLFTVTEIDAGTPNILTFAEDVTNTGGASTNDFVDIINVSKTAWLDTFKDGISIGVTTLYGDEKQESKIYNMDIEIEDILDSNGDPIYYDRVGFWFYVFVGNGTTTGLWATDPRVSGFNVYLKAGVSTSFSGNNWYLYGTIDISQGARQVDTDRLVSWSSANAGDSAGTDVAHCQIIARSSPTTLIRYQDNTGFNTPPITGGENSAMREIGVSGAGTGWKTAVVANRRAYIGNVTLKDTNNNLRHFGDAIFKSPVNKFDSFTAEGRLEATVRDGDEIIKLEEYADRLLEFKKKKMTIINISQDIEFIENTYVYKGVAHPAATCKTDFGIAWVNEQGCYLYDGQKVSNLLEKGGRQIIKESVWSAFVFNPMIGYIPKKRQLIVADDVGVDGSGAAYLYDMVTQSWVKAGAATFPDADSGDVKTNFVTDWNNDLIFAYNDDVGTVVKWDDGGDDSTAFVIQTKDIDFGQPAQAKRIYKVHVTYTGVSSLSVNVDYQTNGDSGWTGFASGEPLTASSGQNEAILTLSSPVECYSFQLKFSGTGKTAFEINDVSIVYRVKGQR